MGEGNTGGEGDSNYQNLKGVRSTPKQAISGLTNNLILYGSYFLPHKQHITDSKADNTKTYQAGKVRPD